MCCLNLEGRGLVTSQPSSAPDFVPKTRDTLQKPEAPHIGQQIILQTEFKLSPSIGNGDHQSHFTVPSVAPTLTTSRSCFGERAKLKSNYLRTDSGGISGCVERGGGNIGEDFAQYPHRPGSNRKSGSRTQSPSQREKAPVTKEVL